MNIIIVLIVISISKSFCDIRPYRTNQLNNKCISVRLESQSSPIEICDSKKTMERNYRDSNLNERSLDYYDIQQYLQHSTPMPQRDEPMEFQESAVLIPATVLQNTAQMLEPRSFSAFVSNNKVDKLHEHKYKPLMELHYRKDLINNPKFESPLLSKAIPSLINHKLQILQGLLLPKTDPIKQDIPRPQYGILISCIPPNNPNEVVSSTITPVNLLEEYQQYPPGNTVINFGHNKLTEKPKPDTNFGSMSYIPTVLNYVRPQNTPIAEATPQVMPQFAYIHPQYYQVPPSNNIASSSMQNSAFYLNGVTKQPHSTHYNPVYKSSLDSAQEMPIVTNQPGLEINQQSTSTTISPNKNIDTKT